jgi:TDG/mug DNA glycosylase family protein
LLPEEDRRLLEFGYGSTNIVDRPTKSASEIEADEYREGAEKLERLLLEYSPRIACYMGIGVYRRFSGKKEIGTGLQQINKVEGVADYVCSSPSGLNRIPYSEQLECFINLGRLKERIDRR